MKSDFYIKIKDKEFFDFKKFFDIYPDKQWYLVCGQRANGKSYSTNKFLIDEYFKSGKEFIYLRRYEENVKTKYLRNALTDLEEYIRSEYNQVISFYNGCWLTQSIEDEEEGKSIRTNGRIMGRAFSINQCEKMKSTSYSKTSYILYEEYVATQGYLIDEINLLMNIISTVFRNRKNCHTILLGNTISKRDIYTEALGISIKDFPKGSTKEIQSIQGNVRTNIVLHRCKERQKLEVGKIEEGFTSFGKSNYGVMINEGDFECRKGLRHIGGITFSHLRNLVPNNFTLNCKLLKSTDIFIKYLDISYRFYYGKLESGNTIGGFMRAEITKKCKLLLSSDINDISNNYRLITNFNVLGNINTSSKIYYDFENLREVINTSMFITENDDCNEDILRAIEEMV